MLTRKIVYRRTGMSRRPRLELKLNLSRPPPRGGPSVAAAAAGAEAVGDELESGSSGSGSSSPVSPPSSCVSSETEARERSPEAAAMVLAGCARCFMYVMVAEEDPKCPKCKSVVLLDFLDDNSEKKKK